MRRNTVIVLAILLGALGAIAATASQPAMARGAVIHTTDKPLPKWFSWGNTSDHHNGHPCIVAWGGKGKNKAEICSDGFAAVASSASLRLAAAPGLLQDDSGNGYAFSPVPGATIDQGTLMEGAPVNGGAWRLEQNFDSGACNNGHVSNGLIKCPWTGAATHLDATYAGQPIYTYALAAHSNFCSNETPTRQGIDVFILLTSCTGTDTEMVPEGNLGTGTAVLSVSATQAAGGSRRVLCGGNLSTAASAVSPGKCTNGHQTWVFTVPGTP